MELYARKNNEANQTSYTVFEKGYPYSICRVYVREDGSVNVGSMTREDRNMHIYTNQKFDTLPDALVYVRGQYEAAMADYHRHCAEIMQVLGQGLSKVDRYNRKDYNDDARIVVRIGREVGKVRFRMVLTPQEAITALDYLYKRCEATVSICGAICCEGQSEYRTAWAEWTIPVSSNDYHLLDWRSCEGVGRK